MDKETFYNSIDDKYIRNIRSGEIVIDSNLRNTIDDKRLGISLQISINSFEDKYHKILKLFKSTLPNQYYYPYCDLHTTIFDFNKAKAEYKRKADVENCIIDLVQGILKSIKVFPIMYKGFSFSSEAGIIRGYDFDILINIRKKIREAMIEYKLENDERYESQSAHITFMRFIEPIANPNKTVNMIDKLKNYSFGEMQVDSIDLVEHDWYNLEAKKRIIKHFRLN
jgi:2'-5' RNA ligase